MTKNAMALRQLSMYPCKHSGVFVSWVVAQKGPNGHFSTSSQVDTGTGIQ